MPSLAQAGGSNLIVSKAAIGRALFLLSRIRRIHIIGCSRSGTTMLHLAMVCFKDTIISDEETEIEYPNLSERLRIVLKHGWPGVRKHYVTKRIYAWFKPDHVERLLATAPAENVGLINLIRDPKDVLVSRYVGSDRPYVSPEHWYESIAAAERVFSEVPPHLDRLTVRYEDFVSQPQPTASAIARSFALEHDPAAYSIDRVRDNFERANVQFKEAALRNTKGLRNVDARSIGLWRNEAGDHPWLTSPPHIRAKLEAFCKEHGYEPL